MSYTTPPTFTAHTTLPAASLQILSDDITYLVAHVQTVQLRDNGSDYTIASNTFANIDGTNLSITAVSVGSVARLTLLGTFHGSSSLTACFDFSVNGTRWGTGFTDGLAGSIVSNVITNTVLTQALVTGLTPGSNTFKPMWKATANTLTGYSGAGSAGTDFSLMFMVETW